MGKKCSTHGRKEECLQGKEQCNQEDLDVEEHSFKLDLGKII
jgi:hypothetical protein